MRIDLTKTIEQLDFPPEIWAWLDLVGEVVAVTQEEALERDKSFVARTQYQALLRRFLNREIASLNAVYTLLRMEFVYQAAAHVRLFCENVITLRFILLDRDQRTKDFLDYSAVDAYKIGKAYLERDTNTARPEHLEAMRRWQAEHEQRFAAVRSRYTYKGRRGKDRLFGNWCNRRLIDQAADCGPEMERLYELGYRQLSAYVNGSAWALRRQSGYIRAEYDPTVVMVDLANLTRILLLVWVAWLKITSEELGWNHALGQAQAIIDRCNELDDATMQAVATIREASAASDSGGEATTATAEEPRCVLCGQVAPPSSKPFTFSAEGREYFERSHPGVDADAVLAANVLCPTCEALPPEERKALVQRAVARELDSYRDELRRRRS